MKLKLWLCRLVVVGTGRLFLKSLLWRLLNHMRFMQVREREELCLFCFVCFIFCFYQKKKPSTLCFKIWSTIISNVLGKPGKIITSILQTGLYAITALQSFNLEKIHAEEFLEVYKGVVPEYHLHLDELTSGLLIAMEITGTPQSSSVGTTNIVKAFREFAGPGDPELARVLRGERGTLRGMYGEDKVKNAIHVTDLEEDGALEVQFFFRIMARP